MKKYLSELFCAVLKTGGNEVARSLFRAAKRLATILKFPVAVTVRRL
jgi:hypothetical protein